MFNEVTGQMRHRILLNYRVDPSIVSKILPDHFAPQIHNGYAIAGICQVSVSKMRPKGFHSSWGITSNNTAHRIAVIPKTPTKISSKGVYVPMRHTDSRLNSLLGGVIFPGRYTKANFEFEIADDSFKADIREQNGERLMFIEAEVSNDLHKDSIFKNQTEISDFFKLGNLGWSETEKPDKFDLIELKLPKWSIEPLEIKSQFSSFFSNENLFPQSSIEFDSAMIMRNLSHSWISRKESVQRL